MSKDIFQTQTLNELYRYGIALTGKPQDAQDVLHTALEKYLNIGNQAVENERAFVRKIMRNCWYDELRKKRRNHVQQTEHYETQQEPISIGEENPIEQIIMTDQLLQNLWQSLEDSQRELLYFSCVLEMSTQQIADETETPRGTILARLYRLKQRLKEEHQATNTMEAQS